MLLKIKTTIKKNTEIFALFVLIIITIISTNYYNYNKNKILNEYKNLINNVYVKKSVDSLFNNLEPIGELHLSKTSNNVIAPSDEELNNSKFRMVNLSIHT